MSVDRETDRERVRRMLAGEEAAFEAFFDATFPALYRFALVRLAFDRAAAADVAQATICRAIAKLHTFRGEAALQTWVYTLCRHELYAWHKRQGREPVELVEDEPEIRAALESLRAIDDVEASLDRRSVSALVQRVLDHLPAHYSSALEWKYVEELSTQEIATRLEIGVKAAESLLTRARRAFREAFETMAPVWPGAEAGER
jgi:RNA polymerase sigma-70 factor (ECF subfamily)